MGTGEPRRREPPDGFLLHNRFDAVVAGPKTVNESLGVAGQRNRQIGISCEPRLGAGGNGQTANKGEGDVSVGEVAVDPAQRRFDGGHANRSTSGPGHVTRCCSRTFQKPGAKQALDFLVASLGMTPTEILAHQIEPRAEQVERRAECVDDGWRRGYPAVVTRAQRTHARNVRLSKVPGKPPDCSTKPSI